MSNRTNRKYKRYGVTRPESAAPSIDAIATTSARLRAGKAQPSLATRKRRDMTRRFKASFMAEHGKVTP